MLKLILRYHIIYVPFATCPPIAFAQPTNTKLHEIFIRQDDFEII